MVFEHDYRTDNLMYVQAWIVAKGREGWELVSVIATDFLHYTPIQYTAFMKRAPKLETEYD